MSQSTLTSPPTTPRPAEAKQRRQPPPGPPWPTALRNSVRFGRDPLLFLRELRGRYGDLVTLPTVVGPWTLVFHPDGVRHVVQENHFNYRKEGISTQVLSLTLGNGLMSSIQIASPQSGQLAVTALPTSPLEEARASVSAISLRSPKRSSSWR
jgi:hypothetical protein